MPWPLDPLDHAKSTPGQENKTRFDLFFHLGFWESLGLTLISIDKNQQDNDWDIPQGYHT